MSRIIVPQMQHLAGDHAFDASRLDSAFAAISRALNGALGAENLALGLKFDLTGWREPRNGFALSNSFDWASYGCSLGTVPTSALDPALKGFYCYGWQYAATADALPDAVTATLKIGGVAATTMTMAKIKDTDTPYHLFEQVTEDNGDAVPHMEWTYTFAGGQYIGSNLVFCKYAGSDDLVASAATVNPGDAVTVEVSGSELQHGLAVASFTMGHIQ
jgi:hypothetical protein